MKGFYFWQKWLMVVGVLVVAFGAAMALLNGTPLFDLINHQIDPVFWGPQGPSSAANSFQQWIYGTWGATLAGWGVFMVFTARHAFKNRERWAWNCMVAGLAIWYLLDTGMSVFFRVYFNAIFNTVVLILLAIPLGFTRSEFS